MTGKVVLVTGAGRGIGAGVARAFGQAGANVAAHCFDGAEQASELCAEIERFGGKAVAVEADLSGLDGVRRIFDETERIFGRLDVLINNAAYDPGGTEFLEADEALYDRMMNVNLKAIYFCSQAAARMMIRQGSGGRIINISSVHGEATLPHYSIYAASKGGVDALTRQLALDLGAHQITVNAIAPGFIEVERTIRSKAQYSREETARKIPGGRVGFPQDVASLALFLASPEASYLTGAVIRLDGGLSARLAF